MTAKQTAIELIGEMPDDATLEDIIESLCFRRRVEDGLADMHAGRVASDEEVARQVEQWLQR